MLHFPEGKRNSVFPKLTKWFENLMNAPEAIEAYGRTILCRKPLKPSNLKIDRSKRAEFLKNLADGKKEKNVLDSLPPSSLIQKHLNQNFQKKKIKTM